MTSTNGWPCRCAYKTLNGVSKRFWGVVGKLFVVVLVVNGGALMTGGVFSSGVVIGFVVVGGGNTVVGSGWLG